MATSLPIGDFSRATHLSVKTLRHYHRVGLLEPADVDQFTGHRRYTTEQIPAAQVIRRFRALDMPLDDIRGILRAPDIATRNELIAAHLDRLEAGLARTQTAVESLRELLDRPEGPPEAQIIHRSVTQTPAAAISATIDVEDAGSWLQGAVGELQATLRAQSVAATGPPGGIYSAGLFTAEHGRATVFVPCAGPVRPIGRVEGLVVPAAELAIIRHAGAHDTIDRAYGALATHVTEHALAVDGPIREYYLAGPPDADPAEWQTEIGWPIFRTGAG